MKDFRELGLPQTLLNALQAMRFDTPTPIQAQAIPVALEGRDILGSAQTGTGKTGAFGIPLIAHVMNNKQSGAIVMTPTRELAVQVMSQLTLLLGDKPQIRTALLIGGDSMYKQLQQLRNRPRIIVGTPGRINDHLQQRTLNLSATDFLVLDETDRMLDMGFDVQIEKIIRMLPQKRQTLLFSATLPPRIVKLSENYLNNPKRISVGSVNAPVTRIKQELIHLNTPDKFTNLIAQLEQRTGSVIVFVKTKRGADRIAKKLNAAGQSADAIHGDLNQNKRNRVIQAFRDMKYRVLVATDVAARGLDIPHIEHVINHDLPQQPEDYIHRIGRTARAGAEGEAVCFITPEDRALWREIHVLMNPSEKGAQDETASRKPAPRGLSKKPRGSFVAPLRKPEGEKGKKPHNRSGFAKRTMRRDDEQGGRAPRRDDARSPYSRDSQRPTRYSDDARSDRRDDTRNARRDDSRPARRDDTRGSFRDDARPVRGRSEGYAPRRDQQDGPRAARRDGDARRNDGRPARKFAGAKPSRGDSRMGAGAADTRRRRAG